LSISFPGFRNFLQTDRGFSRGGFACALPLIPCAAFVEAIFDNIARRRVGFEMVDDGGNRRKHHKAGHQRHAQPFPVAPEARQQFHGKTIGINSTHVKLYRGISKALQLSSNLAFFDKNVAGNRNPFSSL
jgi:hypothetical protein